jgi:hypothetical protein
MGSFNSTAILDPASAANKATSTLLKLPPHFDKLILAKIPIAVLGLMP